MSRNERQERRNIARSQEESAQQQRQERHKEALDTQASALEALTPDELRHLAALAIVKADNDRDWTNNEYTQNWAYRTAEYTRATALISLASLAIAQSEVVKTDN
jgi:hypothetical protein